MCFSTVLNSIVLVQRFLLGYIKHIYFSVIIGKMSNWAIDWLVSWISVVSRPHFHWPYCVCVYGCVCRWVGSCWVGWNRTVEGRAGIISTQYIPPLHIMATNKILTQQSSGHHSPPLLSTHHCPKDRFKTVDWRLMMEIIQWQRRVRPAANQKQDGEIQPMGKRLGCNGPMRSMREEIGLLIRIDWYYLDALENNLQ